MTRPTSPGAYRRWVNAGRPGTPPPIPKMAEAYILAQDETRQDIQIFVNNVVSLLVYHWIWKRTIRKTGPVVAKLLAGEKLSGSDSSLLLTSFSLSAYLASRHIHTGRTAQQKLLDASARLGKQISNRPTTKET